MGGTQEWLLNIVVFSPNLFDPTSLTVANSMQNDRFQRVFFSLSGCCMKCAMRSSQFSLGLLSLLSSTLGISRSLQIKRTRSADLSDLSVEGMCSCFRQFSQGGFLSMSGCKSTLVSQAASTSCLDKHLLKKMQFLL